MHQDIDTVLVVETPEQVVVRLPLAGPETRAIAFVVDIVIIFFSLLAVVYVFAFGADLLRAIIEPIFSQGGAERVMAGLAMLLLFAFLWLWFSWFEAKFGKTPGKKLLGLRVLTTTGKPIAWREAWLRHLMRFTDLAPAFGLIGFLSAVSSPTFQRLGDRVAGTVVVRERAVWRRRPELRIKLEPTPEEAVRIPLVVRLQPEEAEVIDRFLRRANRLGAERSRELAEMIAPALAQRMGASYTDPLRFLSQAYERYAAPVRGAT